MKVKYFTFVYSRFLHKLVKSVENEGKFYILGKESKAIILRNFDMDIGFFTPLSTLLAKVFFVYSELRERVEEASLNSGKISLLIRV